MSTTLRHGKPACIQKACREAAKRLESVLGAMQRLDGSSSAEEAAEAASGLKKHADRLSELASRILKETKDGAERFALPTEEQLERQLARNFAGARSPKAGSRRGGRRPLPVPS